MKSVGGFRRCSGFLLAGVAALALSHSVHAQTTPQDRLLEDIVGRLETGRSRQALTEINHLFRGLDPADLTPRFLFAEVRVLLANGFVEEAQRRLEALKQIPGWEQEVDPTDLLATELSILKASGEAVEALSLVEKSLPYLDEIDPPYSPKDTRLFHVYADLLALCSQYEKAVRVQFDLLKNGDLELKGQVAESLLDLAHQKQLKEADYSALVDLLGEVPGLPLCHRFALLAYAEGFPEISEKLLAKGLETSGPNLRSLWAGFLKETEDNAFLSMAADLFLKWEKESAPPESDFARTLAAYTLDRIGRSDEALDLVRDRLGTDLDLRFFAARVYANRGDIPDASRIYAELEQAQPGFFLEPWGTLLSEVGNTQEALQVWSQIPLKGVNKIDAYRRWGKLLKDKGFLQEARDAYLKGIEVTGNPAYFANELLEVSLALSDVEGTLLAYQTQRGLSDRNLALWAPARLLDQLRRTQQVDSFSTALETVLEASRSVDAPWRDFAIELQTDLVLFLNERKVVEKWLHSPPPSLQAYWNTSPGNSQRHWMEIGLALSMYGEDSLACEVFDRIDADALQSRRDALEAAAKCNARIGETTQALKLWTQLYHSPRSGEVQKQNAALAVAELLIDTYQPGQALEWLAKLSEENQSPTNLAELWFLRGEAYTRLHERKKATSYLQKVVDFGRNESAEALFWLAEWELWQRERDPALELYRQILTRDPGQDLANETLWRLRHLGELNEETLPLYSMAAFFEAGGQFSEAEVNYRKLAAAVGPSDLTDWVYYRIGKMFVNKGNQAAGFEQWRILLEKTDNETLKRKVRFEMASLSEDSTQAEFESIVFENPDSLLGDLAREKLRGNPLEASEPVEPEPMPVP